MSDGSLTSPYALQAIAQSPASRRSREASPCFRDFLHDVRLMLSMQTAEDTMQAMTLLLPLTDGMAAILPTRASNLVSDLADHPAKTSTRALKLLA